MSTRTFLSCDICNPQGVRYTEQRRVLKRSNPGGRSTDGRAWYDGDVKKAIAYHGWKIIGLGKHACPRCFAAGRTAAEDSFPTLRIR
jgi:hypothetical protein